MKRSILKLDKFSKDIYQTIFKNNHGRVIFMQVQIDDSYIQIVDCIYIDRAKRNGKYPIPKKHKITICRKSKLLEVIANELDKFFYGIEFSEKEYDISAEKYINQYLAISKKYKFLIFIEKDGILKTRFKNRVHRTIYLEIKQNSHRGLIQNCHYCDRLYKRNNMMITPFGLKTIYFDYSTKKMLEMVNDELNCDFSDIIITKDTFNFEKNNIPICGSI